MAYSHFTLEKRLTLELLNGRALSLSEIARRLRVNKSTVSRELERNSAGGKYKGHYAHRLAMERKKRPEGVDHSNRLLLKVARVHLKSGEWRSKFDIYESRRKRKRSGSTYRAFRFFEPPHFSKKGNVYELSWDQKRWRSRYLRWRERDHGLENALRSLRDWRKYWEPYYQRLKNYRYPRVRWEGEAGKMDPLGLFKKLVLRPKFPNGYRTQSKAIECHKCLKNKRLSYKKINRSAEKTLQGITMSAAEKTSGNLYENKPPPQKMT